MNNHVKIFLMMVAIAAAAATLSGCADGADGASGAKGKDGKDGVVIAVGEELVLEAARDYGPSEFFDDSVLLSPGVYELPQKLPLLQGAAGTGWASIVVGDLRLCYQGNGGNTTEAGDAFIISGMINAANECHNTAKSQAKLQHILITDTEVVAAFHGGGVSAPLQVFSSFEAVIKGLSFVGGE